MIQTQIELPEPLLQRIEDIAARNDISMAELIRRATEAYLATFPDNSMEERIWELPVLPPRDQLIGDPSGIREEALGIEERNKSSYLK